MTAIEWTDRTWNPTRGCRKVSPGCAHCYAERFAERFRGKAGHPYVQGFDLRLVPEKLDDPRKYPAGSRVFVNSMSDLFFEDIPESYIQRVFDVIRECPSTVFQILTKRAARMALFANSNELPRNVWLGVSVEDQKRADERIPLLRRTYPAVRFLSVEPLLERVTLGPHLRGIDWVIVGGESGPGARPMNPSWVREIRDDCVRQKTPFFFKQWGAWAPDCLCPSPTSHRVIARPQPGTRGVMFRCGKKAAGRELDGRTWDEFPK